MAFPTTLSGAEWPSQGSGNIGPFLYNGNVYVLTAQDNGSYVGYVECWKATDPTSSFTAQDTSNRPDMVQSTGDSPAYMDAYLDGSLLHIMCVDNGVGSVGITWYACFDLSTDSWVDVVGDGQHVFQVYNPTDAPTTHWGGITVRSDGDIIIVHPGENPSTMGGTYQEVAYSRMEYDGATSFTDGTNGLNFINATADYIDRNDGGSWVTSGFAAGDIIEVTNAEDSGNNRRFYVESIQSGTGTNSRLYLGVGVNPTTNTNDTTAVVTKLYSTTTGVVVASTATKNDNYLYAYPVMGSSDQCHFGYMRDTNDDFYLRALSSGNSLRTQRTQDITGETGDYNTPLITKGISFTRSSTEKIAFQTVHTLLGLTSYWERVYFTHFTDDSNPTFTVETMYSETHGAGSYSPFMAGFSADAIATAQDNYTGIVKAADSDLYLYGDDGGTSWSDQNSSTAIRTGSVRGISANIYTRGGNRVYAFLYNDAGTVKYDEFILYGLGGGIVFTRRPMRFLSRSF